MDARYVINVHCIYGPPKLKRVHLAVGADSIDWTLEGIFFKKPFIRPDWLVLRNLWHTGKLILKKFIVKIKKANVHSPNSLRSRWKFPLAQWISPFVKPHGRKQEEGFMYDPMKRVWVRVKVTETRRNLSSSNSMFPITLYVLFSNPIGRLSQTSSRLVVTIIYRHGYAYFC